MQRSLALIGLSGVGKSSIARLLAARLGWPWADTDGMLVAAAGVPVAALFAAEGEAAFREREAAALADALGGPEPRVVATGGGIVLREANRTLLRKEARCIWLDAPDQQLVERLQASSEARPLLAGDPAARLAALRLAREPLYAALAELHVTTASLHPEQVVDVILEHMCYN